MSICKHLHNILFIKICKAYPTQTNGELVGGFFIGVTSVVYIRTAFGDYGTPSVMLLCNIRAPKRRWGNYVATIKRIFVPICKHLHNIHLSRYASISYTNKWRTRWWLFNWGYLSRLYPHRLWRLRNSTPSARRHLLFFIICGLFGIYLILKVKKAVLARQSAKNLLSLPQNDKLLFTVYGKKERSVALY